MGETKLKGELDTQIGALETKLRGETSTQVGAERSARTGLEQKLRGEWTRIRNKDIPHSVSGSVYVANMNFDEAKKACLDKDCGGFAYCTTKKFAYFNTLSSAAMKRA